MRSVSSSAGHFSHPVWCLPGNTTPLLKNQKSPKLLFPQHISFHQPKSVAQHHHWRPPSWPQCRINRNGFILGKAPVPSSVRLRVVSHFGADLSRFTWLPTQSHAFFSGSSRQWMLLIAAHSMREQAPRKSIFIPKANRLHLATWSDRASLKWKGIFSDLFKQASHLPRWCSCRTRVSHVPLRPSFPREASHSASDNNFHLLAVAAGTLGCEKWILTLAITSHLSSTLAETSYQHRQDQHWPEIPDSSSLLPSTLLRCLQSFLLPFAMQNASALQAGKDLLVNCMEGINLQRAGFYGAGVYFFLYFFLSSV